MHSEVKRLTAKYHPSKMFFLPFLPKSWTELDCNQVGTFMKFPVFDGFTKKMVLLLTFAAASQSFVYGQPSASPERFQLLNGLRVLLLSRPGDQDVLLKLRIHSGAAFDLSGKAGSMALLGDLLFPDPATREYFTEEMQGRLNVVTDYDSITITMQGRAQIGRAHV